MHTVALLASLVLALTGRPFAVGVRPWYVQPVTSQTAMMISDYLVDKRAPIAEPTCEELRAMWRYSKRQSRAAEATNELPMYRDPFTYNIWEVYPERGMTPVRYQETYATQTRGHERNVPIYGTVVHKAPINVLRNGGMQKEQRTFEELYGTINRHPSTSRQQYNGFRSHGNPTRSGKVSQRGSFQQLKEIIKTEKAHELQKQRKKQETAAREAAFKEMMNADRQMSIRDPQKQYLNSLQAYQDPRGVNYDFGQPHYMSSVADIGQVLSRGDQYAREYMLR